MEKVYVPVVVHIDENGKYEPKVIEFDGRRFLVDKVLDSCRAACQSVGGVGIRYTCVVLGKVTELWEEKGRWFVVAKGGNNL